MDILRSVTYFTDISWSHDFMVESNASRVDSHVGMVDYCIIILHSQYC